MLSLARVGSMLLAIAGVFVVSPSSAHESLRGTATPDGALPRLSVVIALAREHAPEVLSSAAQVTTAHAALTGARLSVVGNPYVEVVARRPTVSGRSVDVEGQLWLPLEILGQRSARIEEARALIEFERRSLAYAEALAVAEALKAYGAVTVGAERIRVFESLLDVARSEAKSYEARYDAADATLRDEKLAELELGRYGVLLEEAKADVYQGFFSLNRVTGGNYSKLPDSLTRAPAAVLGESGIEGAPALRVPRAEAAYHGRSLERFRVEGVAGALSLILNAGRDEFGGPRVGGGVGYVLPALRRNQGERARAAAERDRARLQERVLRRVLDAQVRSLRGELAQVRRALDVLNAEAEPAAVAAVAAATQMQQAGKSDLFLALTSRRELGLLRLRRLDLVAREWDITSGLVAILGGIS